VVFALSCVFKADPVKESAVIRHYSPMRGGGDETASVPRRLGLLAENCTSGARLTPTASARVVRAADINHSGNQVIRCAIGETAPTRIGTPAVQFSELTQRAGRIAP
jgi:hypothetical protein